VGEIDPPLAQERLDVVSDVARGRAEQLRDLVPVSVLLAVDAGQGLLRPEQRLGEGAGRLRLADARGAEQERAEGRTSGVAQAGEHPREGAGQGLDRTLLADDSPAENGVEPARLLGDAPDLHELSGCAGGGMADRHDDPPGRGKEAPWLIERVHGEGCSRDLQGV
jgi:hypothetical protein